jgi:alpha-beta hydrolase superfamily lysophospholipase
VKRAVAGLALCVLVVGCGGESSKESVPKQPPPELASRCAEQAQGIDEKPFWFRASDKALLNGVAVGDGDVAVVLAHGYPADLCGWLSYAKTLASRGYLAFAFDFRGLGASPQQFADRATRHDLDLEAAYGQARRLGADKVFLMGGSYGGAAVVWAGAEMGSDPAGIIDLSGPTSLFNVIGLAPKVTAPLLVVGSRHDNVVSPHDSRELVSAAGSEDKQVAIYAGGWHAQDLLYSAPYQERVDALIMEFLRAHS